MFNLIVTASLRNRVFVLAASLLLIGLGSWLIPKLNIDVLPDLNRPPAPWPGLRFARP